MIPLLGAGGFGAIVGWYVYYINRYRKADVQFSDLATVTGIIGGAAITQLFGDAEHTLFGAYGIGLFVGFFGYFVCLLILVARSRNFDADWFLDGRRKSPEAPYSIPSDSRSSPAPMDEVVAALPAQSTTIVVNAAAPADALFDAVNASPNANRVIAECENAWDANKSDCSAFVRTVCNTFSVALTGDANAITDQIQNDGGWQALSSGGAAKVAADEGKLVVAGLKGANMGPPQAHGHVVIVVSGPVAAGRYPSAYWGQLGGVGRRNATINYAWRAGDRDKVIYAARAV